MELVAVYGSLKQGSFNHHILAQDDAIHVADTLTLDKYLMYDGPFPRVIKAPSTVCPDITKISCEVYAVHNLDRLDTLEGHPSFFQREQVKMLGIPHPVWLYICQTPASNMVTPVLTSGFWDPLKDRSYKPKDKK
jgi:gamma-glutamylcyclotransferase (GGCT)/AIG2-like uncharacterized protein YtfP